MAHDHVLIVGVGGLGVPAAWALARVGGFCLTLVDPDPVELSNLARQVIYRATDIGAPKAKAAVERLRERFGGIEIEAHPVELDSDNVRGLIGSHDFVIDATDNPAAKFLINDACVAARRPFVYGGVIGMRGQAMTVIPGASPCLRCLFETPPDEAEIASCREAGIVGAVAGAIGEIQGAEALRVLRGARPALASTMLTYDAAGAPRVRLTPVDARPECGCGAAETEAARARTGPAHQLARTR